MVIDEMFVGGVSTRYQQEFVCKQCRCKNITQNLHDVYGCDGTQEPPMFYVRCAICDYLNNIEATEEECKAYFLRKYEIDTDHRVNKIIGMSFLGIGWLFAVLFFFIFWGGCF